jgi:hypothetical protein
MRGGPIEREVQKIARPFKEGRFSKGGSLPLG